MAKQSIIKAIKAKPNERGRTSHLPLVCSTKVTRTINGKEITLRCDEDFLLSYPNQLGKPTRRVCALHWAEPPTVVAQQARVSSKRKASLLYKLGLIT